MAGFWLTQAILAIFSCLKPSFSNPAHPQSSILPVCYPAISLLPFGLFNNVGIQFVIS
jgi:hypothetical protein